MRADHLLHDSPVVFADAWALRLIDPPQREQVESGALHRMLGESGMRPTQGHIVARARYADDALRDAVARGVDQYLVLAAGLDSSCLRQPPHVRVFEVDHPATQRAKRERLASLAGVALREVEFVGVDFAKTSLADGLAQTGYEAARAAFLTWIGVTMYLPPPVAQRTLADIRACVAPASEVVFDYTLHRELMPPEFQQIAARKVAYLVRQGEPRVGAFAREEIERSVRASGFELVEDLGAEDLDRRYFAGRTDGLRANPEHRLARVRAR